MLEIRPCCEHCGIDLPAHSTEAMICSFECTFCRDCAQKVFHNVCPNCGGGFEPRPIRPGESLKRHPASNQIIHKPKDLEAHKELLAKFRSIPPENR